MSEGIKLSVVMIDGSFREGFHILDCLSRQSLPRADYEVIWVEFFGKPAPQVAARVDVQEVCLNNLPETRYHAAACFNEGIRRSRGEVIVIPDADIVVSDRFLQAVWEEHSRFDRLVVYFHRWDQRRKKRTDDVSIERLQADCELRDPTNYGGCVSVRKKWLLEINGYEQHRAFAGEYHAAGLELCTRLQNLGLAVMWHPTERIYHPWHPGTGWPPGTGGSYDRRRTAWMHGTCAARARSGVTRAYLGLEGQREPASAPPVPPHGDPDGPPSRAWLAVEAVKRRLRKILGRTT